MVNLVGKEIPFSDAYTGPVIAALVDPWRKPDDVSICGRFCRWHGSDDCPFRHAPPQEGYCAGFTLKVLTQEKFEELLREDAAASGKPWLS